MADAAGRGQWLTSESGPLFGLRMSVSRRPLRIGPAWAVMAGALAAGAPLTGASALLRLVGAVILADAAWGAVWAVMAGSPSRRRDPEAWGVPYAQVSSPMMRLTAWWDGLAPGMGCHEILVSALLAFGLATLLSPLALALSAAVVACAFAAQLVAERGRWPAALYAAMAVGLPWTLGVSLAGASVRSLVSALALGVAFTILEWGAQRLRWPVPGSVWGAIWGQAAVLVVLAALRLPWAVALAAILFLPPAWWLFRARAILLGNMGISQVVDGSTPAVPGATGASQFAAGRSAVWWWFVLILAAVALRQLVLP